ncbi:phosphopantetheine-binding protein [Waterburya agarophytonicola]|uniref:phosphopantetheine-binding protein n=1 Tax=Waterburya agarophytonicola TaxID=2886916 RepID=UPI001E469BA9|nr:phosphopantetheine-binding protein [Waterburya agarophytonicola]
MQLKSHKSLKLQLIKAILLEILALELDISAERLESNKTLYSYGLDSLRVAKIIGEIDSNFQVKLSFETFEELNTVESLAKFISKELARDIQPDSELVPTGERTSSNVTQGVSRTTVVADSQVSPNKTTKDTGNFWEQINKFLKSAGQKPLNQVSSTKNAPKIVGIASNFPVEYFEQRDLTSIFLDNLLSENIDVDPEEVNRFFTNVTLKGRHFALSPLNDLENKEALREGIEAAVDLAENAIDNLLQSKGLKPEDISMVVESSILPATPSIFSRVMSRSSFSSNIKRMSLYGVGCMNGVHGLSKINDYLEGHPTEAVILISVELASVLWQGSFRQDLHQYLAKYSEHPEQYSSSIKMTLVTAALFGDGAVALLIVGSKHPLYKKSLGTIQPQIIDTRSNLIPNTSDLIGVDILLKNSSFRAIVKPEVPDLLPDAIAQTIEPLLEKNNLSLKDISHWILHPGGPKIVRAIEEKFNLSEEALSLSWLTLFEKGNLSSAHVLYILEQLLSSSCPPNSGEFGLMIAMGPGLSQEAILLKF